MAEARAVRYTDIVPAKKTVIGSDVVNAQNEDLGKIEDIVLDAGAGRIAYAVLSFGGFLGMGDKYFAIPWDAFRFNLGEKRAVLNVDKKVRIDITATRHTGQKASARREGAGSEKQQGPEARKGDPEDEGAIR